MSVFTGWFTIVFLLDWLLNKATDPSLTCYQALPVGGKMYSHLSNYIRVNVSETALAVI